MTGLRGVFAGVLALVALETIVSRRNAAERTAGLLGDVSGIVTRLLDPTVAAIPDVAGVYTGNAMPPNWGGVKAPASAPSANPSSSVDPPANGKAKPPRLTVQPA